MLNIGHLDSDFRDELIAILADIEDHYLVDRLAPLTEEQFIALKTAWISSIRRIMSTQDLVQSKESVDALLLKLDHFLEEKDRSSRVDAIAFSRAWE